MFSQLNLLKNTRPFVAQSSIVSLITLIKLMKTLSTKQIYTVQAATQRHTAQKERTKIQSNNVASYERWRWEIAHLSCVSCSGVNFPVLVIWAIESLIIYKWEPQVAYILMWLELIIYYHLNFQETCNIWHPHIIDYHKRPE